MLVHLHSLVLANSKGNHTERQLQEGITSLMGSADGGPAFVGCLHDLALNYSDVSWLPVTTVVESALRSDTLHSGVRIVEQHLDCAATAPDAGGGKRGRTSGAADVGAAAGGEQKVRMQLAELYRASPTRTSCAGSARARHVGRAP